MAVTNKKVGPKPKLPLFKESTCVKEGSFRHESRCISDAHISKTKAVVCALAICVCSLLAAGATQTASAQTTILKTAHRGLEVGAFQTSLERNKTNPAIAMGCVCCCAQLRSLCGTAQAKPTLRVDLAAA